MSVTPKRNSVRPEPCRHGDRREIHQVHEVGVGAEAGIELHGVGKHLRNLEGGTSGRQEQEVNFRPFLAPPRGSHRQARRRHGTPGARFCFEMKDESTSEANSAFARCLKRKRLRPVTAYFVVTASRCGIVGCKAWDQTTSRRLGEIHLTPRRTYYS
jgi:hypothetical protein